MSIILTAETLKTLTVLKKITESRAPKVYVFKDEVGCTAFSTDGHILFSVKIDQNIENDFSWKDQVLPACESFTRQKLERPFSDFCVESNHECGLVVDQYFKVMGVFKKLGVKIMQSVNLKQDERAGGRVYSSQVLTAYYCPNKEFIEQGIKCLITEFMFEV